MDRSNGSRPAPATKPTHRGAPHLNGVKRLAGALLILDASYNRCVAASPQLRLETAPSGIQLVVGPIPETGVLSILTETNLSKLASGGSLFFQTNSPIQGELRLPIADQGLAFFRAVQWSGMVPALAEIPAGSFVMGTPPSELEQLGFEGPQTPVTFTYSFRMGRAEVTQAEYQAVMGVNPSYFAGIARRPVERITWDQAMDYCARLTEAQRTAGALPSGWTYRLPSEFEWEYACRAGTTTAFGIGPDLRSGQANFDGHYEYESGVGTVTNPLGKLLDKTVVPEQYAPNAWGLYNMHGNLWEWCLGYWSNRLPGVPVVNPTDATTGDFRILRGGSWYNSAANCRSGSRGPCAPGYKGNDVGFRVVLAPINP